MSPLRKVEQYFKSKKHMKKVQFLLALKVKNDKKATFFTLKRYVF